MFFFNENTILFSSDSMFNSTNKTQSESDYSLTHNQIFHLPTLLIISNSLVINFESLSPAYSSSTDPLSLADSMHTNDLVHFQSTNTNHVSNSIPNQPIIYSPNSPSTLSPCHPQTIINIISPQTTINTTQPQTTINTSYPYKTNTRMLIP